MDFDPTDDERAFQRDLRAWLDRNLPDAWRTEHPREPWTAETREIARQWQARLASERYVALGWPAASGGREASLGTRILLQTELLRARAPRLLGHVGLDLVGPALIAHGSDAQKRRHLDRMRTGEEFWCQGFSEPGAGSDLASLATRAERRDDNYIVNGQKVWTSVADVADWCFLLARTDPSASKHAGISVLLVDMRSPGIEVRPLRQLTGDAEFNEVFFDDVSVPVSNRLGAEGAGWSVAMGILSHERGPMWTFLFQGHLRHEFDRLVALVRARGESEAPLLRQALAAAHIDLQIMRLLGCRGLTTDQRGGNPGPASSLEKLFGSQVSQRLRALSVKTLGPEALLASDDPRSPWEGRWLRSYLYSRAETLLGGTSEIQRSVIARQLLGLPG
ncbi:MAG: acyl-CoA dehydrogenase family protein [Candidatus Binatia bacterium]|nr:acyl-CoA dehydrogenase family protein [Candidatus Binatia bacterium]